MKERDNYEDLDIAGRILVKVDLKKYDMSRWV
jgi:hypothetical protein